MVPRTITGLAAAAGLAAAIVAAPRGAEADTITLKNGRELQGRLIEEKKDYIVIKVAATGGTMRIPKRDIATFTEDDKVGQDLIGKPRPAVEPAAKDGDKKEEKKDSRELGDDERKWIKETRTKLEEEMKKLGPTAAERRKAVELSGEEQDFVQARIAIIQSNKGSRNLQRQETVRELIGLGPKGVRPLVGLLSEKTTVKAVASDGLAQLCGKPDEKWLAYDADAPGKLLAVLEDQGDEFAVRARANANRALETLTGKSVGWPAIDESSDQAFRSAAEAEAAGKWRPIVAESVGAWKAELEKAEARRKKVGEWLKKLDGNDWRDVATEMEQEEKEKK